MPYKSYILSPLSQRGMITSRTTQSLKEYSDSFSLIQNFLLKDGAFVGRANDQTGTDAGSFVGVVAGPVWGIHYYNATDPTNASATPFTTLLVHSGETTAGAGSSTLMSSNAGGTTIKCNILDFAGADFTTTDPSDIFFLNVKNRCFVTGRKMAANVYPTIVQKYPSHSSYKWGIEGPTADLTYDAYTNATNGTTLSYYRAAGAGVTTASTAVTKVGGPNWDSGTAWVGKTILLNNVPYTIVSYTPTTGPMTISPAYVAATPPATVDMLVRYGEIAWTGPTGPQYAYAYYNSTTGHISNIGPVLTISEQNITNVRVRLQNIQLTANPFYDKVVIFRTALDAGGILLPLKLNAAHGGTASVDANGFITNTPASSVSYVDFQPDSNLGAILGRIPAPFINNPPPADAKYLAYWDERVWTVSAALPSRLVFSGNSAQIPLGVPEESFPALNFRDITSDDGAITGLKVVGTSLLVATNKYLHFIDGSNENDYRLVRVSSRGTGIDQYAFDEHPGDSSEQSASAIYLSSDKRLWRQYPGGRIEDIGWQVQDKLDQLNLNLNKPAIVKVFQVGKVCMLAVGIRTTSATARYNYLFHDFDEQTWHDLNFAEGLFDSTYAASGAFLWSGTASGINYSNVISGSRSFHIGDTGASHLWRIMTDVSVGTPGTGVTQRSQWLDMGDKTVKKTLQEVVLYVSDTTQPWSVSASFDDDVTDTPLTLQVIAGTPKTTGSGVLRYVLSSSVRVNQFHSLQVMVHCDFSATLPKWERLVVNYGVESTGSAGAPA